MRRCSKPTAKGVATTRTSPTSTSASRKSRYVSCGEAPTKAPPMKWTTARGAAPPRGASTHAPSTSRQPRSLEDAVARDAEARSASSCANASGGAAEEEEEEEEEEEDEGSPSDGPAAATTETNGGARPRPPAPRARPPTRPREEDAERRADPPRRTRGGDANAPATADMREVGRKARADAFARARERVRSRRAARRARVVCAGARATWNDDASSAARNRVVSDEHAESSEQGTEQSVSAKCPSVRRAGAAV